MIKDRDGSLRPVTMFDLLIGTSYIIDGADENDEGGILRTCNRTVCFNAATMKHKFNKEYYCESCAIAIDRSTHRYDEPSCFDFSEK